MCALLGRPAPEADRAGRTRRPAGLSGPVQPRPGGPRVVALLLALAMGTAPPALAPTPVAAQEAEEVLSYDVEIEVEPGGRMLVTERIRVRALGQEIRRGIYRDVPTSFPRAAGLGRIEAPFEVLSVTRGGTSEPYVVEGIGGPAGRGGMRVRIGDADVFLDPGVHDYAIRYATDRWIRFGDDEDQLYWNVTGNGWAFPIHEASARVRVAGLRATPSLESWTGYEGSTATNATALWDPGEAVAEFRSTRTLYPGEGLTVRMRFPSGELTAPTQQQQEEWFRLDWGGWIEAAWVVLFAIAVYVLMWRRVGVDPAPGRATLRPEPPPGYSPAALGFIEGRGYDQSQLSAAIVSMALKGALRISHENGGWVLEKVDESVRLDPEERVLFDALLGGRDRIHLDQTNHATLRSGIQAFTTSLARRLEREYFVNNRRWFVAGLAVSVLGFAVLAWRWRFDINPVAIFLGVWLTGWTAGVSTLVYRLWHMARSAVATGNPTMWVGTGVLGLFSLPFIGAEIMVTGLLLTMVPPHLVVAALGLGVTNVAFYHLLERPTLKGRGVLDQLEGFRAYLGGGEDRGIPRSASDLALFERFLPFAIALGLEARWSDAFAEALTPALVGVNPRDGIFWYHHDHGRFDARSFTSSLASGLASTLSSASSPPSSGGGGGGGGGGSSGGGGGGGGGGGW
jgi:uncharacterized membrane protein YgcG